MKKQNQKGFSLVELLVVVIIIGIIAAIAIPSLLASRKAANEASAIANLRTIHSAQVTYLGTAGAGTNYTTIAGLKAATLLDNSFTGTGMTKAGYTYTEQATPTTNYCIHAEPVAGAGTRSFGVATDGVIYYKADGTALTCTAGVLSGGVILGN